jgi:hypothetical protein
MHFFNRSFDKNRLKALILWLLNQTDEYTTLEIIEKLKDLGFLYATKGGLSLSIDDLKIPPQKSSIIGEADNLVESHHQEYLRGTITSIERIQQLVDTWHRASETLKKEVINHFQSTDLLNPVYMMAFSGARGNISQVRQLVGMRALMADPQGQIIGFPIKSNFREGLTVTEYMISCYGARKGLVDTALRTADAGYLTRRLVDVSQHVIVKIPTCSTRRGVLLKDIKDSGKILLSLRDRLVGRVLSTDVFQEKKDLIKVNRPIFLNRKVSKTAKLENEQLGGFRRPVSTSLEKAKEGVLWSSREREVKSGKERKEDEFYFPKKSLVAVRNQEISPTLATKIASFCQTVLVRSPLTCSAQSGICQMCYGWSLSEGRLVSLGEAVGIVAAQSIGEPGTQLTMRTFHTGGVFSGDVLDEIKSPFQGRVFFPTPLQGVLIRTPQGKIGFLTRNPGQMICKTEKEEKVFELAKSTILFVRQNEIVPKDFLLAESSSLESQQNERAEGKRVIFSDISGQVFLDQMTLGKTYEKSGKLSSSSRSLGSIWILSSKKCPTSALLPFYDKGSHLVSKETLLARAQFQKQNSLSWNQLLKLKQLKSQQWSSESDKTTTVFNFQAVQTIYFRNFGFFCLSLPLLKETIFPSVTPDKFFFPLSYEKKKRENKKEIQSFFWFFDSYLVQTGGQSWFENMFYNDTKGGGFILFQQWQLFYEKKNVSLTLYPFLGTKDLVRKVKERKNNRSWALKRTIRSSFFTKAGTAGKGWKEKTSYHFKPFLIHQQSRLNWLSLFSSLFSFSSLLGKEIETGPTPKGVRTPGVAFFVEPWNTKMKPEKSSDQLKFLKRSQKSFQISSSSLSNLKIYYSCAPKRRWVQKDFPIGKRYNLQGLQENVPATQAGWVLWTKSKAKPTKKESFFFFTSKAPKIVNKQTDALKEKWLRKIKQIWKGKDKAQFLRQILVSRTIKLLRSNSFIKPISSPQITSLDFAQPFLENGKSTGTDKKEKKTTEKKGWKRNPLQTLQLSRKNGESFEPFTSSGEKRVLVWTKIFQNLILSPKNPFPAYRTKNSAFQKKFAKVFKNINNKRRVHKNNCKNVKKGFKRRELKQRSASLKFGWLYVPKNFSRIGKLHKSYRPSGTGYFEGLEKISFEPWMVEIECLPRSFPWYKIDWNFKNLFSPSGDLFKTERNFLFQIRKALWLSLFISSNEIISLLREKSLLQFEKMSVVSNSKSRFSFLSKRNFYKKGVRRPVSTSLEKANEGVLTPFVGGPVLTWLEKGFGGLTPEGWNSKSGPTGGNEKEHLNFYDKRKEAIWKMFSFKKKFPFFALARKIDIIPLISQKDCRKRFSKLFYKNSPLQKENEKRIFQKKISEKSKGGNSFSNKSDKRSDPKTSQNNLISFISSPIFSSSLQKNALKTVLNVNSPFLFGFSSEPIVIWKSESQSLDFEEIQKVRIREKFKRFAVLHSAQPDVFWRILPISCFPKPKNYSLLGLDVWKKIPPENTDDYLTKSSVDQLAERFEIEKAKRELIRREKSFSLYTSNSNGVSTDTISNPSSNINIDQRKVLKQNRNKKGSKSFYPFNMGFRPQLIRKKKRDVNKEYLRLKKRKNSFYVTKGTYLLRFHIISKFKDFFVLDFKKDFFSGVLLISLSQRASLRTAFSSKKNHLRNSITPLLSPFDGEIPCKNSQNQILLNSLFKEGKDSHIFLSQDDYASFTLKEKKPMVSVGQLVHFGEQISENLASSHSGQIVSIEKGRVSLRKGQSVLFYAGGLSHVSHGQYLPSNSPLLTLTYKRLITGDIVQGIPKIEQFFEAPLTKDGEPLLNSLGAKLRHSFSRFRKHLALPLAVRESISFIQEFVVEGIQRVYLSQGVLISDKHIEVIVRQMTSKVKILKGGNTGLLPSEYINLQRIESINLSTRGDRADYEPVILGITQASLDSESFISAASFQETTRVLSRDSLQGKTDFLRGLKGESRIRRSYSSWDWFR